MSDAVDVAIAQIAIPARAAALASASSGPQWETRMARMKELACKEAGRLHSIDRDQDLDERGEPIAVLHIGKFSTCPHPDCAMFFPPDGSLCATPEKE